MSTAGGPKVTSYKWSDMGITIGSARLGPLCNHGPIQTFKTAPTGDIASRGSIWLVKCKKWPYCWWFRNPAKIQVLYIPGGARYFFHQQYHSLEESNPINSWNSQVFQERPSSSHTSKMFLHRLTKDSSSKDGFQTNIYSVKSNQHQRLHNYPRSTLRKRIVWSFDDP